MKLFFANETAENNFGNADGVDILRVGSMIFDYEMTLISLKDSIYEVGATYIQFLGNAESRSLDRDKFRELESAVNIKTRTVNLNSKEFTDMGCVMIGCPYGVPKNGFSLMHSYVIGCNTVSANGVVVVMPPHTSFVYSFLPHGIWKIREDGVLYIPEGEINNPEWDRI